MSEDLYGISKIKILGVVAIGQYFASNYLRIFGLFGFDKIHDIHLVLGVFDITYLYMMGLGVYSLISGLFNFVSFISHLVLGKIPSNYLKLSLLLIPLVYNYPWLICYILGYISLEINYNKPKIYKDALYLGYPIILYSLPQTLSWISIYQDYKVLESIDEWEVLPIFSFLFLVTTLNFCKSVPNLKLDLIIYSLYQGLCVHDLLYRTNLFLCLFCI